jgi:hypothetical protein
MKAVAWPGVRDIRVEDVPDPTIIEPTDAPRNREALRRLAFLAEGR